MKSRQQESQATQTPIIYNCSNLYLDKFLELYNGQSEIDEYNWLDVLDEFYALVNVKVNFRNEFYRRKYEFEMYVCEMLLSGAIINTDSYLNLCKAVNVKPDETSLKIRIGALKVRIANLPKKEVSNEDKNLEDLIAKVQKVNGYQINPQVTTVKQFASIVKATNDKK